MTTFLLFIRGCRSVVRDYFGEHSIQVKRLETDCVSGKNITIKHSTNYKELEKILIDKYGNKSVKAARNKVKYYSSDQIKFEKNKK